MPSFRSEAEAEIRTAVVEHLRTIRPSSRIMHEINVSSYGGRADVLCVGVDEIIAVEIKSAKDKIDRLEAQMSAMRGMAHHCIAALHEKFLVPSRPGTIGKHAAHYEKDGEFYQGETPPCVKWREGWIYPMRSRMMNPVYRDDMARWHEPERRLLQSLPSGALDVLWRNELQEMCSKFRVAALGRSTMETMVRDLRWHLTGKELTLGVCAALRSRPSIEADAPLEWSIEA